jgi:hypothetical protein
MNCACVIQMELELSGARGLVGGIQDVCDKPQRQLSWAESAWRLGVRRMMMTFGPRSCQLVIERPGKGDLAQAMVLSACDGSRLVHGLRRARTDPSH